MKILSILFLVLAAVSNSSFAATKSKSTSLSTACAADVKKLCGLKVTSKTTDIQIMDCVEKHEDAVLKTCYDAHEVYEASNGEGEHDEKSERH